LDIRIFFLEPLKLSDVLEVLDVRLELLEKDKAQSHEGF
jgi:hypothetical protein